jgi:hypothetical protein
MGLINHHAIIVTSWRKDVLVEAHKIASGASPNVTPIVSAQSNGYSSFAVLPDGSKEGWACSDAEDSARSAIIHWIDQQAYEDGSNSVEWVEVSFGELEPTIRANTPTNTKKPDH